MNLLLEVWASRTEAFLLAVEVAWPESLQILRFRVWGLGFRVYGLGLGFCRVHRAWRLGISGLAIGRVSGCSGFLAMQEADRNPSAVKTYRNLHTSLHEACIRLQSLTTPLFFEKNAWMILCYALSTSIERLCQKACLTRLCL